MNEQYKGRSKAAMQAKRELLERGMKYCGGCEKVKPVSEFCLHKKMWDGLRTNCKECSGAYYKTNKEAIAEQQWAYRKANKEAVLERKRAYREANKEKGRAYREANKEAIAEQKRAYYEANKEAIAEYSRAYYTTPASFDTYAPQLAYAEPGLQCGTDGELLAPCTYCGRMHVVTNRQAGVRIRALNGKTEGECRFYCSTACKKACPVYMQKNNYKGQKVDGSSREVQPQLRQMALARDEFTCQKCGAHGDTVQLHCHHIKSLADDPIESADVDNTITLCKKCHKAVHKTAGCRYVDLQCKA